MTIIGIGGLWMTGLMIAGIVDEIQWAREYPEYGWDIWFIATVVIITVLTASVTTIVWYETWLQDVIERDRQHTESELAKALDMKIKGSNPMPIISQTMFKTLPRKKRIKILKKALEDIR